MGEAAVKSHMKSKNHIYAVEDSKGNVNLRNLLPTVAQEPHIPAGASRAPEQPSKNMMSYIS